MSEARKKVILPIAILAVGTVITFAMIKSRKPVPTRPVQDYSTLVTAIDAQASSHQFVVHTQGTVAPRTEASLIAEVAGQVLRIAPAFANGGFFDAGEVMLEVDPTDYELAAVAARSQVAQARVRAETEAAQAELAREEWAELGDGTSSPLATRQLQLEEANASLAAAEASLRQAERNLERTRVRAPYACRVRQKMADTGQYVTPGAPVAQIFATDYAEVRLPIPDVELAYLDLSIDYRGSNGDARGPEVILSSAFAGEEHEWRGRVVRIEGEIDPVTRMVHVVAQVDAPYQSGDGRSVLPVGLFVQARVMGRTQGDAIVLPRTALRENDTIYVIDDEGRLRFRAVDVLRAGGETVVIGSGLTEGERVCLSTLEAVTDGMRVRTTDEPTPATEETPEATAQSGSGKGGQP